jgi:predicted RNA-binding Zn-ribbon protein involved in translation (DUF1610 family)
MTPTMICPKCGAEMNHQATRLVEPRTREEAEASLTIGGILVAVFACPRCGWIDSRRESPTDS